MTAKRFEVVMNEFDEVEYIMDKVMMEDRDFAEFIDFVEDVCKENEQLKCGNKNLKAILNDFINILNRLQANPTDKQTLSVARDMLQNMGKELEE